MREKSAGFTLSELMLALALLAMLLLLVSALFLTGLRNQTKSDLTGSASRIAEYVLTDQLARIFTNTHPTLTKANFFANDAPPAASINGTVLQVNTEFHYQMDYVTVMATSGNPIGGGLTDNRLKLVTVTCSWWDTNPNAVRSGYGRQSLQIQRVVNENDEF